MQNQEIFLGLVRSNTKLENGIELEKLNCCISPNLLEPVLMFIQGRKDALDVYLENCPEREKLWSSQYEDPQKIEKQKNLSDSQFFNFIKNLPQSKL